MAQVLGRNVTFTIYNADGTSFHGLVMKKSVSDSIVMSLGDKITGDVYYRSNDLQFTMKEYITYNGINYILVNPPTIVKEGMSSDNSEMKGMTKYSLTFYHPMYMLGNFPLRDVAVSNDEKQYLSEKRKFSWIGTPDDFIAKLNKNLQGTQWIVVKSDRFPQDLDDVLSQVLTFDENTIADGLKTMYDEWGVPYIIDQIKSGETYYSQGKRFKVVVGLPSNEIYASATDEQNNNPFVFEYGKGVGLKNNSRTPRNNKIVTRLSGFGSENNIPYGYPQIRWYGDTGRSFTYGDRTGVFTNVTIGGHTFAKIVSYPIYKGILGGAYVELIKHPFTREYLMPSVYRTTLFNKISFLNSDGTPNLNYDPDIELVDYYDAVSDAEHQYPNPINLQAPSFESHGFEDIKPELDPDGDYKLIAVTPLNNDLTPASGWVDDIDDDGNFLQSYFQITLPVLPFDIYACAAITEEMQINMRSGACIGCTFDVQVDWDDYKKNFYDDQGNFAPNGAQRNLTKYPKSNSGRITLILQKDNNTFGTLMPNIYQQPKGETTFGADDGDAFVILGISLPDTYITDAESRLDEEMKSYMLENNVYYFDYPLKFDEHFLATHTHILSQIKPNTVVRFEYAGTELELFVKQLTVKYGENVLPQYDITLTDNVEVTLNQIGQVADDVEKLSSLIAILRQSYGRNVWTELNKKLSKVSDDTAQGFIRMIKGIQVGAMFTPDILGEGGVFRMNADGKVELVTDILYTRVKAYFDNVEIRDYQHTSGNRIASQAQGFKCSRVEWYDSNNQVLEQTVANRSSVAYFRCYWRVDDGQKKTDNQFIIGDLAFCQSAEVTNDSLVTNRFWRLVIGRNDGTTTTEDGEAWVDLSNAHNANGTPKMTTITWIGQGGTSQSMQALSFEAGSGIPTAEDDICQLGNVRDNTRQGAIIEYVSSIDSPTYQIYQDIGSDATNPYSLNNKNYIGLGYNTATGRAYMNVYGDMYIGAKPDPQTGVSPTYIEYKQDDGTQYHRPSLKIKANVEFTNPDSELDSFVQEHQNNYDDSWIQSALDAIQEQIDGELDTWYYAGVPTLNNAPANTWTTDDDKKKHVGDLYYDKSTGFVYRFLYDDENESYYWTQIHDDAISQALRIANQAQDTADNKRRVFICDSSHHTPTPPYDEGDLWVNVKYPWATGATYNNEILKCIKPVPRTEGGQDITTFDIDDWSVANGYTAALKNFVDNTYAPFVTNIQGQVDGKAETWRQATNPANSWSTDTEKANHVGDLWMDTSANGGNKTYIYVDNGESASIRYAWVAQEVPDAVFDEIDGKADIFVSKPTAYNANDMWIIEEGATNLPTDCVAGDIVIADNMPSGTKKRTSYNKSDWRKKDRYTDDSALTTFLSGYTGTAQQLKTQIDQKAETWYQSTNPASASGWVSSEHIGDLWYNTTNQKTYYYDGTTTTDSYVGWKQQNVPIEVFNKIDGKASIFVSQPSNYKANDLWILSANTTVNGVAYKQGEVLTSSADSATYVASHWSKKVRYTDDTKIDNLLANQYVTQLTQGTLSNAIDNAQDTASAAASAAAALGYLSQALAQDTQIVGGLVLSSLIGLRDGNGTLWSGISGTYMSSETGTGYKGHGIAAWYGGGQVDHEVSPSATNYAKSLFRFDGSGYLAGGNITWDKNGIVTIANVYSDVNGTPVPWSGASLQYINNLSTLLPTTVQQSVTYLNPQVSFWNLSLRGNSVATEKWVNDNFITKAFFETLFNAIDANGNKVNANTTTGIASIKAMFGFWTQQYISALGQGSSGGGGGGGGASALADLTDVQLTSLAANNLLKYDGTGHWVNTTLAASDIPNLAASKITSGTFNAARIPDLSGTYLALVGGTMTGSIEMGTSHYIYGVQETSGSMLHFDGNRTVIGSVGATSTLATHLRSKTGHLTVGTSTTASYNVWDSGNLKSETAASGGTSVSLVTTGEKYTWNNKQAKVSTLGSTTKPVYTSAAGTFAECSTYAGGTAVTLNGTSKAASTASFYAPTGAGTNGYFLKSNGSGAPSWSSLTASDIPSLSYVKLSATEQTIESTIGTYSKGIVEFYRTSHAITFISFANKDSEGNKRTLGAIGFKADGIGDLMLRSGSTYYKIYNESNLSSETAASGGTDVSLVTTGEKYSWNNKYSSTTSRTANTVLAAPNGSAGAATFRALVAADIPSLAASKITSGTFAAARIPDLSGTYLPLTGGTLTGDVNITKTTGGAKINLNNSAGGSEVAYFANGKTYSMYFGIGSGNTNRGIYGATSGKWLIYFNASNTILNYGNVGIGTTEPAYKLHIAGTGNVICMTPSSTATYTGILYNAVTDGYRWSINSNKDCFYWWNNNLSAHVLDITNDGNLLFAKGDGNRQVSISKAGTFRFFAATTGWAGGLSAYTNDGTTMLGQFGYYGNANTLNYLYMGTSYSSPWAVVTPSGDVGIGTTSPAYKLDVQGTLGVNGTATIQSYINIDRVHYGALSKGTQLNILRARSMNAGTGNYAYNVVISTFGSGETGTAVNNFPVRIGSQSGATWISAGESGKTFSEVNTDICNTENLYLEADGSIAMYTGVSNDSTNYSSKLAMFINTSCNVGIGTSSPSYKLHVAGVIYGSTGVFSNGYVSALGQNTSSDIRKKDIKENFALGIDEIAAAPIVRYEWKDNKELGRQVGSIAQYWQNVLPESIHEDGDGYLTMQYGVIALLASISAARKIQDHEQRIKELEKENERLRMEVEQLRGE